METAIRLLRELPLLLLSPVLILVPYFGLLLTDLFFALFGRRRGAVDTLPSTRSASVVIPNWNGKDLLEKYVPSVLKALEGNPGNELIVVDDGSTDGSADFLRENFPAVKVVAFAKNQGFGAGSNAGFRAAKNDIVVLLNSDMRVDPDFLQPLLDGFHDEKVFAVACQIFFSDPNKQREESGLTQAWWDNGRIGVRHRIDDQIKERFPCFYPGGGSSAFDRRKFLELGGFDHVLRPFYLEDTDMGMMAWKRGWKVYYEPRSIVWHEHRGTIGKKHRSDYINSTVQKNFLLFLWKNTHSGKRLLLHFIRTAADAFISYWAGPSGERTNLSALFRAFRQMPGTMAARWRARSLAVVSDQEAFRRPLGAYFQDRFRAPLKTRGELSVLFLSPYPIYPPHHGGGVFMYGTAKALATRCRLHIVAVLDEEVQIEQHAPLTRLCASSNFLVRMDQKTFTFGAIYPHAVTEFSNGDLAWMIHRQMYLHQIDVLQIEYTNMAQYGCEFDNMVTALFEHDVYFQSIGRGLQQPGSPLRKASAGFEYLRALRFELQAVEQADLVQMCSKENMDYLLSFVPHLRGKMDATLRAGIDTTNYALYRGSRDPYTMLFLGSFRHLPNVEALDWFVKLVLPRIVDRCPQAKLVIIGSDPPPRHSLPVADANVEIRGFVDDLLEPLRRYAVFVCPILSGSGVRVKLLEAFCAGIPIVSTVIGAEGLSDKNGDMCLLSDDPQGFADHVLDLFEHPDKAREMVDRAYQYVTTERDITRMTEKLVRSYEAELERKRNRRQTVIG